MKMKKDDAQAIEMIRELLYNSKRNLYEVFRENTRGDLMEVTGFQ